jgi:ArsR family transcriptional regulator
MASFAYRPVSMPTVAHCIDVCQYIDVGNVGSGPLPEKGRGAVVATRIDLQDVTSVADATGPACCPTGLAEPMDRTTAEDLARLLKAVADPARLQLLALIRSSEAGEACACDLTEPLGLSQPTVSHHLKVLTEAGLVRREQRGTWAWFSLVPGRLAELAAVFT